MKIEEQFWSIDFDSFKNIYTDIYGTQIKTSKDYFYHARYFCSASFIF
jgi:hypothetical protein